ncbi:MAG: HAD family hydrolase [Planctomycetota bacterium]
MADDSRSEGVQVQSDHDLSNLTVFGDHINDIKMLQLAGKGVTVTDAEPQVKAIADEIIGSNNDDAVVKYITDHQ